MNSKLTVTGKLTANGEAEMNSKLTVTGKLTANGEAEMNSKLTVTGKLTANGEAEMNSKLTVTGKLTANGEAEVTGKLTAGEAEVKKTLHISSPDGSKISLHGKIGGATYGFSIQSLQLQIHTDHPDAAVAFGYETGDSFMETMRIQGSGLYATGPNPNQDLKLAARGTGQVSVTNRLTVKGAAEVESKLTAKGDAEVEGKLTAQGLHVTTNAVIDGNLFVKGNIAFQKIEGGNKTFWKKIASTSVAEAQGDVKAPQYDPQKDGPFPFSDTRLKTDLHSIPSALAKVIQLRGVTFRWNELGLQHLTREIETTLSAGPGASAEENRKLWQTERAKRYQELSTPRAGVLAQEVEAVLPEAVTTGADGYKSVSYCELIPLVIEALKEEDKIVQEQAKTIARQQTEIEGLTFASRAGLQMELHDIKRRLGYLEATMNGFLASEENTLSRQLSK